MNASQFHSLLCIITRLIVRALVTRYLFFTDQIFFHKRQKHERITSYKFIQISTHLCNQHAAPISPAGIIGALRAIKGCKRRFWHWVMKAVDRWRWCGSSGSRDAPKERGGRSGEKNNIGHQQPWGRVGHQPRILRQVDLSAEIGRFNSTRNSADLFAPLLAPFPGELPFISLARFTFLDGATFHSFEFQSRSKRLGSRLDRIPCGRPTFWNSCANPDPRHISAIFNLAPTHVGNWR